MGGIACKRKARNKRWRQKRRRLSTDYHSSQGTVFYYPIYQRNSAKHDAPPLLFRQVTAAFTFSYLSSLRDTVSRGSCSSITNSFLAYVGTVYIKEEETSNFLWLNVPSTVRGFQSKESDFFKTVLAARLPESYPIVQTRLCRLKENVLESCISHLRSPDYLVSTQSIFKSNVTCLLLPNKDSIENKSPSMMNRFLCSDGFYRVSIQPHLNKLKPQSPNSECYSYQSKPMRTLTSNQSHRTGCYYC